jgi:DNA-directed RNA polymerase specialized sigma24 family protein
VVGNSLPGFEAGDLLGEVLLKVREKTSPNEGAFYGLFKTCATRFLISEWRKLGTMRRHIDLFAPLGADPQEQDDYASGSDAIESHHACEMHRREQEDLAVEEVLSLLSALSLRLKKKYVPVLEAILEEVRSGERTTDKELARGLHLTANQVCKMRGKVREHLARQLAALEKGSIPLPSIERYAPEKTSSRGGEAL